MIEVLQAVHLSLAFPLFVVVVAVDSLWLTRALTEHYRDLLVEGASPDDYLEKIFQVPFWVRPLDKGVRRRRRLPWDHHATPPTSARVSFLLAMTMGLPACAHALASAAERHPGGSLPLGKAIHDISRQVASWLRRG